MPGGDRLQRKVENTKSGTGIPCLRRGAPSTTSYRDCVESEYKNSRCNGQLRHRRVGVNGMAESHQKKNKRRLQRALHKNGLLRRGEDDRFAPNQKGKEKKDNGSGAGAMKEVKR